MDSTDWQLQERTGHWVDLFESERARAHVAGRDHNCAAFSPTWSPTHLPLSNQRCRQPYVPEIRTDDDLRTSAPL